MPASRPSRHTPVAKGVLDFSRPVASTVLAAVIAEPVHLLPQRAGHHPRQSAEA